MQEYFSDQDLAYRYGVSRITPWRWTRAGRFPPPVKLGDNITRWARADVEKWEAERAAELAAGVIPQESEQAARSTLPPYTPPKLARGNVKSKTRVKRKSERRTGERRDSSKPGVTQPPQVEG